MLGIRTFWTHYLRGPSHRSPEPAALQTFSQRTTWYTIASLTNGYTRFKLQAETVLGTTLVGPEAPALSVSELLQEAARNAEALPYKKKKTHRGTRGGRTVKKKRRNIRQDEHGRDEGQ